jgi:hypothetical protein
MLNALVQQLGASITVYAQAITLVKIALPVKNFAQ